MFYVLRDVAGFVSGRCCALLRNQPDEDNTSSCIFVVDCWKDRTDRAGRHIPATCSSCAPEIFKVYGYEVTCANNVFSNGETGVRKQWAFVRVGPSERKSVENGECVAVIEKAGEQGREMPGYRG